MNYKGICCNLSCQGRQGLKAIPGFLPGGELVSFKGLEAEGHAVTMPNVTVVPLHGASATSGAVGAIVGNNLQRGA